MIPKAEVMWLVHMPHTSGPVNKQDLIAIVQPKQEQNQYEYEMKNFNILGPIYLHVLGSILV